MATDRWGVNVNSPYILEQSAVPVCLAPNGTVATNGVVTLGTALPTTYSGGIWLRLPANAVVGGAAGLYWAVMSSTTQGQVYTNFADPATQFIPYIPGGTLVAATGSNSAYTQTTASDITLVNVTVPGGAMGANGGLRQTVMHQNNNSAGAKAFNSKLGGQQLRSASRTTTSGQVFFASTFNRGLASQVTAALVDGATGAGVTTVNTASDQSFTIAENIAVATDFIVIESFMLEVLPS